MGRSASLMSEFLLPKPDDLFFDNPPLAAGLVLPTCIHTCPPCCSGHAAVAEHEHEEDQNRAFTCFHRDLPQMPLLTRLCKHALAYKSEPAKKALFVIRQRHSGVNSDGLSSAAPHVSRSTGHQSHTPPWTYGTASPPLWQGDRCMPSDFYWLVGARPTI